MGNELNKIFLFSLMALLFAACGSDDDEPKIDVPNFTAEDLCAEWYSMDESGLSATNLIMTESSSLQRVIYANPKTDNSVLDEADGVWFLYPENSVIRLQVNSKTTGNIETEDYKVLSLGKYEMTLRSVELGLVQNFHKVLGSVSSKMGTEVNLSELDFFEGINAKSFVSYNTEIAQVSNNGTISFVSFGETCIEVATEEGAFVVKVSSASLSFVDTHVSEIGQNFNDVVARYGEPSKVSDLGNGIIGNLFNAPSVEPNLAQIQINYDKETLEVTRILARYNTQEGWREDYDYISKTYILSDFSDDVDEYYCDAENFMMSKFFILPFEQDGKYYVNYGYTGYYVNNGKF